MKVKNLGVKIIVFVLLLFAIFTFISGIVLWRIDTFVIGVNSLLLSGAIYLTERSENSNNN